MLLGKITVLMAALMLLPASKAWPASDSDLPAQLRDVVPLQRADARIIDASGWWWLVAIARYCSTPKGFVVCSGTAASVYSAFFKDNRKQNSNNNSTKR